MTKYRIQVDGDFEEIERVLNALFQHGYVLFRNWRIRKFEIVLNGFTDDMEDWRWILIGGDQDCKMVLDVWSGDYMVSGTFKKITIEEFLKLIK